jgi:hypothetical protein
MRLLFGSLTNRLRAGRVRCARPVDVQSTSMSATFVTCFLIRCSISLTRANRGTWMSGPNANESVMLHVPGSGPFVRALLPVKLTGRYSVMFGVWVSVHPTTCSERSRPGGHPSTWTWKAAWQTSPDRGVSARLPSSSRSRMRTTRRMPSPVPTNVSPPC